jgi:hypothetical protein
LRTELPKSPGSITNFDYLTSAMIEGKFLCEVSLVSTMTQHDATQDTRRLWNCQPNL